MRTNRKLSAIKMTNSSVKEMFENTLKKYWAFNGAENKIRTSGRHCNLSRGKNEIAEITKSVFKVVMVFIRY